MIIETEYVDRETGEILSNRERGTRIKCPVIHFSERCLQRHAILDSLHPEVRAFAVFVLKFRNLRRGITPGISTLCRWYAILTDRQACHVRRYVPKLRQSGVLDGDSLVGPLFQIPGKQTSALDHKQEDIVAEFRFADMLLAKYVLPPARPVTVPNIRSLISLEPDHTGSWLPDDIAWVYC
jgi:hypothetical protein